MRGTSEPEKMLKNAKTEFWNEHEEIARLCQGLDLASENLVESKVIAGGRE